MDIIKELGLVVNSAKQISDAYIAGAPIFTEYVSVPGLRAAIEKLPVVYGSQDTPSDQLAWSVTLLDCDTHKARLICVEKLVKEPVKLEKVIAYPKDFTCYAINGEEFGSKLAGKKVKVVFEEVIE